MDRTYTLTSFNCKNVKRSVDNIRDLCLFSDIVALQETWLLPHDLTYLGGIDVNFSATGTSSVDTSKGMLLGRPFGGVAILWRSSLFQNVAVLQCSNPRICAIKITTNNRPIVIICVYMPTDVLENLSEFTDCLGMVSALVSECCVESVYVLGDFNAHPNENFHKELMTFCQEQNWACVDLDRLGVNSNNYTFISESIGSRRWLDHCLATQSAVSSINKVYVKYDVFWSDHLPLVVECNLDLLTPKQDRQTNIENNIIWGERTDEQINTYRIECHKRLRLIDFPTEFQYCSNSSCNLSSHKCIVDKLYVDIISALSDSSEISKGYVRRKKKKFVMGWNKHVKDAHMEARLRYQFWLWSGKPVCGLIYNEMSESRKIFKSRLKWCQNNQDQIRMDSIASKHSKNDFRGFWKNTNKLNIRPGLPVSVDGVSDSKCIADLFRDHFHIQSPLGPAGSMIETHVSGDTMTSNFSNKEVRNTIKSMSKGKSPGHDGLSIEHLQHAGPHMTRVLCMLYNLCVSHSYMPHELMRTIVVAIVKNKTGDMSDRNNYRPISLATIVSKVFDSLLDTQLNKYLNIHDNQFGFRTSLSTDSAVLCLKQTINYYTDRGTPVFSCFLDLSKAFDLVSYDILWKKLEDLNFPSELVRIFKYWYGKQVNNVRWAGKLSEPYTIECGVRQGGITSPALFNLYVNALIVELSNEHVGCHIDGICVNNLSYADDMVLLSASVCGLRKLIDICESYAVKHGLVYNLKKSKCMVFEVRSKHGFHAPPVRLNGVILEKVTQFKYLGHMLTTDLKDNVDIDRERRALSVRANMIARRFARCSSEVKVTLFLAFCTSFYTCSLWVKYTRKSYGALRVQYNNAFRMLMGLPRDCSASGMFAEARVDCFYSTMRKRAASLVRRVRASSNSLLRMIADRVDCAIINHCCSLHVICGR